MQPSRGRGGRVKDGHMPFRNDKEQSECGGTLRSYHGKGGYSHALIKQGDK